MTSTNDQATTPIGKLVQSEVTLFFTRILLPIAVTVFLGFVGFVGVRWLDSYEKADADKTVRLHAIELSQGRMETKMDAFIDTVKTQRADDQRQINGNTNRIERMENRLFKDKL